MTHNVHVNKVTALISSTCNVQVPWDHGQQCSPVHNYHLTTNSNLFERQKKSVIAMWRSTLALQFLSFPCLPVMYLHLLLVHAEGTDQKPGRRGAEYVSSHTFVGDEKVSTIWLEKIAAMLTLSYVLRFCIWHHDDCVWWPDSFVHSWFMIGKG